jgi:hypothetical protein
MGTNENMYGDGSQYAPDNYNDTSSYLDNSYNYYNEQTTQPDNYVMQDSGNSQTNPLFDLFGGY